MLLDFLIKDLFSLVLFSLFFFLCLSGLLCEKLLELCNDSGGAVDKVCDLTYGVGGSLCARACAACGTDHFDLTVGLDYEESYGSNGKTCSAAAAEVLGLNGVYGLVFNSIVESTRCKSYGYLGDRDDGNSCLCINGIADDCISINEISDVFKGRADYVLKLCFICQGFIPFEYCNLFFIFIFYKC